MAQHHLNIKDLESEDYPYDDEDLEFEGVFDEDWMDEEDRLYDSDDDRHSAEVRHNIEDHFEKKRFREENDYLYDEYDDF